MCLSAPVDRRSQRPRAHVPLVTSSKCLRLTCYFCCSLPYSLCNAQTKIVREAREGYFQTFSLSRCLMKLGMTHKNRKDFFFCFFWFVFWGGGVFTITVLQFEIPRTLRMKSARSKCSKQSLKLDADATKSLKFTSSPWIHHLVWSQWTEAGSCFWFRYWIRWYLRNWRLTSVTRKIIKVQGKILTVEFVRFLLEIRTRL